LNNNRYPNKRDLRALKWAVFRRICWVVPVAIVGIWFVRQLTRGKFANKLVALLSRLSGRDWDFAYDVYTAFIRNNLLWIMVIAGLVAVIILFLLSTHSILRYFKAISEGIAALSTDGEIQLPLELEFIEAQLLTLRQSVKKKEADAKLAEQRKNDLVVYLAHDIKTPLTSVIGYLSLLEEAPDLPQPQRAKYLGITLKKAQRLEQLVDEFFEITRFNLQTIVLHLEKVDLTFLLQQMADEFTPLLAAEQKSAQVDVPPIVLEGDPDKLARVFQNIMKNAVAYSRPGSAIQLSASLADGQVQVDIVNQGSPIPQTQLDRIFEKFYRLDSARSSQSGGAGLGLAIAKEITEAHGGSIAAQSNGEEIRFTVCLPLYQQEG
jgi:two-component system sensor histidine kinase VanS